MLLFISTIFLRFFSNLKRKLLFIIYNNLGNERGTILIEHS